VFVTPVTAAETSNDGQNSKTTFKLTTSKGKSAILPPPPARKYVEALDGHPKMGWDQEALLSAAFDLLDSTHTGRLTIENMSRLAKNVEVQLLLRFTVFGSLVKKRRWEAFRSIFPYEEAYIGLSEWMSAANAATIESNVPLHAIRSEKEHVRIANELQKKESGWQWLVSSSTTGEAAFSAAKEGGWFAERARHHLFRKEVQAQLKRWLQPGDVVWALHGGGVVWMQAVVECVNADGTCDLTFPLSAITIGRLREASLTRKLVQSSFGSKAGGGSSNNQQVSDALPQMSEITSLAAVKGHSELYVCGRVFDLLFGDKVIVSAHMLISGFYDPTNGIRSLVESNTILSAIAPSLSLETTELISNAVARAIANQDEGEASGLRHDLFPPLATVLCETFKTREYKISKADFLAFCALVNDRSLFRSQ